MTGLAPPRGEAASLRGAAAAAVLFVIAVPACLDLLVLSAASCSGSECGAGADSKRTAGGAVAKSVHNDHLTHEQEADIPALSLEQQYGERETRSLDGAFEASMRTVDEDDDEEVDIDTDADGQGEEQQQKLRHRDAHRRRLLDVRRVSSRPGKSYKSEAGQVPAELAEAADESKEGSAAPARLLREVIEKVTESTPTGTVGIGTPEVKVKAIYDTGSSDLLVKSWTTLQSELATIDSDFPKFISPKGALYNHNTSSTWKVQLLKDKQGHLVPSANLISYGSGTALTLNGRDTLRVGGVEMPRAPIAEIVQDSLGPLHSTGAAGVVGLQHMSGAKDQYSTFTVLRGAGKLHSFGFCQNRDKGTGAFIWNDRSAAGRRVPVLGQQHWAVSLSNVHLPGVNTDHPPKLQPGAFIPSMKDLQTPAALAQDTVTGYSSSKASVSTPKFGPEAVDPGLERALSDWLAAFGNRQMPPVARFPFCKGGHRCAAVLDTGSNIIVGPTASITALSQFINIAPDCSNLDTLPTLAFNVGDVPVKISPKSYVMKLKLTPDQIARLKEEESGLSEQGHAVGGEQEETSDISRRAPGGVKESSSMSVLELEWRQGGLRSPNERSSSSSSSSSSRSQPRRNPWLEGFQRMRSLYGVDVRASLPKDLTGSALANMTELCMSAFVSMDVNTSLGALWVLGTPLFDSYYVRFSHPPGKHRQPEVFLEEIEHCSTCRHALGHVGASLASVSDAAPPASLAVDGAARGLLHHSASSFSSSSPTPAATGLLLESEAGNGGGAAAALMRKELGKGSPPSAPLAPVSPLARAEAKAGAFRPRERFVHELRAPSWAAVAAAFAGPPAPGSGAVLLEI